MKIIGIYKITNPNGKVYIGQSNDVLRRKKEYQLLRCKTQYLIYRSLKKYGFDNHKFEIVCQCSKEDLKNHERYYQDLYDVLNTGLNLSLVSTKQRKYEHAKSVRESISKSRTGMKFSKSHIENIRKARTGTILKESTKKKIGKISKRITSDAMRKKPLPYANIILDLNTGVFYYSERDLSQYHNLGKTAINKRLKKDKLQGYKRV